MTKEEAIKHLHTYSSTNGSGQTTQEQHEEAKRMAIKALEAQQWIPCSERLPEKDGKYLVTHRKFGKLEATWNIFYGGDHASWLWNDEIIAWMPLPEPWKGEEP